MGKDIKLLTSLVSGDSSYLAVQDSSPGYGTFFQLYGLLSYLCGLKSLMYEHYLAQLNKPIKGRV